MSGGELDAIAKSVADQCHGDRKPGASPQRYAIIYQAARMGASEAMARVTPPAPSSDKPLMRDDAVGEELLKALFLMAHSGGWRGNQLRRDAQQVDAEKSWQMCVEHGAIAKLVARHATHTPVEEPEKGAAEKDEEDLTEIWRNLALQFDEHRMQAMVHLRALVNGYPSAVVPAHDFLQAPPLNGEQVLAQRLAALSATDAGQTNAAPSIGEAVDEFATLEPWEHDDQRELSRLYNHKPDDKLLQFNRGHMRMAIRHGRSPASLSISEEKVEAVARILCRQAGYDPDGAAKRGYGWIDYEKNAQEVIAALTASSLSEQSA